MESKQEPNKYATWKQNSMYLYDYVFEQNIEWPVTSVKWVCP